VNLNLAGLGEEGYGAATLCEYIRGTLRKTAASKVV